jgi:nucleoside-diphosphate-sugar epimerase
LLPVQHEKLPLIVNITAAAKQKIAVTGANGWVGNKLVTLLQSGDYEAVPVPRAYLSDPDRLQKLLVDCQSVVHLAALVHQMREPPSLNEFRKVNCDLTLNVARAAAVAGVQQMVFVSTAKVMGEQSVRAFKESDFGNPQDDYSRAKFEAEIGLSSMQKKGELGSLKVCVLRPPLIYGAGVGANFAKLEKLAASRLPLPLGSATALRSMVDVDLFNQTILKVFEKRAVLKGYEVFFVTDPVDKSTASIITAIRKTHGRASNLISIPAPWLRWALSVIGKRSIYDRLFTSLQVDGSRIRAL